jgi:phosphate-selective porin OprO/OprP
MPRTFVSRTLAAASLVAISARAGAQYQGHPGDTTQTSPQNVVLTSAIPIRAHIGGLFQTEDRAFLSDAAHGYTDEVVLRRARLDLNGTIANHFDFRFLPDFGLGAATIQDLWINVRYGTPIQLQIGKFKEPVGLELVQYDADMAFIERSLVSDLVPNRDVGAQLHGDIARGTLSYGVGIFDGVSDGTNTDRGVGDNKDVSGRVLVRPFAATGVSALSELGLWGGGTIGRHLAVATAPDLPAYKASDQQASFFSYVSAATPGDTAYAKGGISRATGAGYWYVNRLGVLGEYATSWQAVSRNTGAFATIRQQAWQGTAEVALTADHPTYTGVTPKHQFDPAHGHWGAILLTGRYALFQADPRAFADGFADSTKSVRQTAAWAGGANWYFNRWFRFSVNYERTSFQGGAKVGNRPTENALLTEAQLAF